jgi:protein SCO1/2
VVLVDKTLRIRGIYNGSLGLEMGQLVKDIKLLLAEK